MALTTDYDVSSSSGRGVDATVRATLGDSLADIIAESKILVIGAGGIGCELMKNLALSGFINLDVIDLDTIDISNLNRQFLFRRQHVGMSKAEVANLTVSQFNDRMKIVAKQAKIQEPEFGLPFFQKFDIVLNGLDNTEARKHVNRMCIAAGVPSVEAGSTGYLGQVFPIVGGSSECYECNPIARAKSFPVCTIRSTPEKPEHCIAWAKVLFELLFGADDDDNLLVDLKEQLRVHRHHPHQLSTASTTTTDDASSPSGGSEVVDAQRGDGDEAATHDTRDAQASRESQGAKSSHVNLSGNFASIAYDFLFNTEIAKQAAMPDAWLHRAPPTPLPWPEGEPLSGMSQTSGDDDGDEGIDPHAVWTLAQSRAQFRSAIGEMTGPRSSEIGFVTFDKDDATAVQFVAAAANLRMANFNIPRKSLWDIQSIAGSIVPAIASTNAIVAGLQTTQLIHLLSWLKSARIPGFPSRTTTISKGPREDLSLNSEDQTAEDHKASVRESNVNFVWVYEVPSGRHVLRPTLLEAPQRTCYVCQLAKVELRVHSLKEWSLIRFVNKVVRGGLSCAEPLVELSSTQLCIYDSEIDLNDPEEAQTVANLNLSLAEWDVVDGSVISITDISQGNWQCDAIIREDSTMTEETNPELFDATIPQNATNDSHHATDDTSAEIAEEGPANADVTQHAEEIAAADDDNDRLEGDLSDSLEEMDVVDPIVAQHLSSSTRKKRSHADAAEEHGADGESEVGDFADRTSTKRARASDSERREVLDGSQGSSSGSSMGGRTMHVEIVQLDDEDDDNDNE